MAQSERDALRMRRCRGCWEFFLVCRRCDRGQQYCSGACREPARQAQLRAARLRHPESPEGRADHRDHQRALRERRRVMDHPSEAAAVAEILAVAGTTVSKAPAEEESKGELLYFWNPHGPSCRFCGRPSLYLDVG